MVMTKNMSWDKHKTVILILDDDIEATNQLFIELMW